MSSYRSVFNWFRVLFKKSKCEKPKQKNLKEWKWKTSLKKIDSIRKKQVQVNWYDSFLRKIFYCQLLIYDWDIAKNNLGVARLCQISTRGSITHDFHLNEQQILCFVSLNEYGEKECNKVTFHSLKYGLKDVHLVQGKTLITLFCLLLIVQLNFNPLIWNCKCSKTNLG